MASKNYFDYINKKHQIKTRAGIFEIQYIFKNTAIAAAYGYTKEVATTYVWTTEKGVEMEHVVAVYQKRIDDRNVLFAVVDILSKYNKHRVAPVHWCLIPSEVNEYRQVINFKFVTFEQLAAKYIEANALCRFDDWLWNCYNGLALTNIYNMTLQLGKLGVEYKGERYQRGERLRVIDSNTKNVKVQILTPWRGKTTDEIPIILLNLVTLDTFVCAEYPENCVLGL